MYSESENKFFKPKMIFTFINYVNFLKKYFLYTKLPKLQVIRLDQAILSTSNKITRRNTKNTKETNKHILWLNSIFKYYIGMTAKESSTSYKTKKKTVITRKPTLTDQRAQEGKKALQQYSQISPEERHYQKKPPVTKLKWQQWERYTKESTWDG